MKNILERATRGELHYILGRFGIVRSTYSALRATPFDIAKLNEPTLFPNLDPTAVAAALKRDAIYDDLALPPASVQAITEFCRSEPLVSRHQPDFGTFRHDEVVRGYLGGDRPTPIGAISNPLRCAAVQAVKDDPRLRCAVHAYLRYPPSRVLPLLYWSFASSFTDAERRAMKQHVIDYHYDVGGFNFVYVSFYLLDTRLQTGAHVMVKGSHHNKSLRMLLGSAVAAPAAIYRRFGKDNEIVIEGPAGTGFIQDTACYHRASPPTDGDRLLLQLRFS